MQYERILIVITCCDTEPRILRSYSKDRPNLKTYETRKKDTMNQIHTELCETPICIILSNRSKESVSFHSLMNTTIKTKIYTMVDNVVVTYNKLYGIV